MNDKNTAGDGSNFLIGQRVIVGREICTVDHQQESAWRAGHVWVFVPSRGYASCFDAHNVHPLPGGQL